MVSNCSGYPILGGLYHPDAYSPHESLGECSSKLKIQGGLQGKMDVACLCMCVYHTICCSISESVLTRSVGIHSFFSTAFQTTQTDYPIILTEDSQPN